jgi:hypothetical protein
MRPIRAMSAGDRGQRRGLECDSGQGIQGAAVLFEGEGGMNCDMFRKATRIPPHLLSVEDLWEMRRHKTACYNCDEWLEGMA